MLIANIIFFSPSFACGYKKNETYYVCQTILWIHTFLAVFIYYNSLPCLSKISNVFILFLLCTYHCRDKEEIQMMIGRFLQMK